MLAWAPRAGPSFQLNLGGLGVLEKDGWYLRLRTQSHHLLGELSGTLLEGLLTRDRDHVVDDPVERLQG